MGNLPEIDGVSSLLSLGAALAACGPGFLIMYFRTLFITGRNPKFSEFVFQFVFLSAIYYAFALPVFMMIGIFSYLMALLFLFVLPSILGISMGILHQKGTLDSFWELVGVRPVHPSPTAWDFCFNRLDAECWVIVSLKDGRKIHGRYGRNSFASSDLSMRDLYIEDIRDEQFQEIEYGERHSLWVNESSIDSIEMVRRIAKQDDGAKNG